MKIITIYPNFANKGGAQDVALQLANRLNNNMTPVVLTDTPYDNIFKDYRKQAQFIPFSLKAIIKLAGNNTVFLSHHRKSTSLLMLCKLLLGKKLHVIHIAHNTFSNLKMLSLFPQNIIAVSNGVKENLINYFHVPDKHIHVIHNGIKDYQNNQNIKTTTKTISILIPGRICAVKQQVEIVKQTKGKLAPHIHIHFAGSGEDVGLLKKEIGSSTQYRYTGFINLKDNLNQYDYVCLFSKNEGLALVLIEGCMFGKPLITNNIPGVLDINRDKINGFVYPDFLSLIQGINNLPFPNTNEYIQLSNNARLRYEKLFTEDKMIKQYERIIELELKK